MRPPRPRKIKRLGDVVSKIAQPIAQAIDIVFGTDVVHCGQCQKRKEFLNKLTEDPVDSETSVVESKDD